MDLYKDYRYKARKKALQSVNIILGEDVSPKLHNYLQLLDDLKIKPDAYEEYYGEVKKIVNSFIINWTEVMNTSIKMADEVTMKVDKDELLRQVDITIEMQKLKQANFDEFFRLANTPEAEQARQEVSALFNVYMENLEVARLTVIEIRHSDTVKEFAKEHYGRSLRKKNDLFSLAHTYLAILLTRNIKDINVSLKEIVNRSRKNLRHLQERRDEELDDLLNQLYNKNKERLAASRKAIRTSLEIAEVERCIDKLRKKIETNKSGLLTRVEEESNYWNDKLTEFNRIAKTITDLNDIQEKLLVLQKKYFEERKTKIRTTKLKCWEHLEGVFKTKLSSVNEKKKEAARALLSFFSVRGPDNIFFNDSIGHYYVDEYGHHVYFSNNGLKVQHVNCAGELFEAPDTEVYYYDDNGRYILNKNGEKIYKIASCTSSYRLVDGALEKCTLDCGHSEHPNPECRMSTRDGRDIKIRKTKAVDIKGLLDKNTALYLWDSFGHILPDVLYEVANEKPKNPIHYFALKLLHYKYSKTLKELTQKKDEAKSYRTSVYKDRKDKELLENKEWKAKQMKRSKPVDLDETEARAAFGQDIARQEFIHTLVNFYG